MFIQLTGLEDPTRSGCNNECVGLLMLAVMLWRVLFLFVGFGMVLNKYRHKIILNVKHEPPRVT